MKPNIYISVWAPVVLADEALEKWARTRIVAKCRSIGWLLQHAQHSEAMGIQSRAVSCGHAPPVHTNMAMLVSVHSKHPRLPALDLGL